MSMEHIFRNLNDIRVFDTISGFQKDTPISLDDIMDILDLPFREQIQIEDSIKHLVEQEIIGVSFLPEEYSSGCETCKEHKSHKPIIYGADQIETYYLADNDMTKFLVSAVFENSNMYAKKIMKERGIEPIS